MGNQLRKLGEAQFARASAVGAKASFGDWKIAPELLSGSLAAAAAELVLELPKNLPPMYIDGVEKSGAVPLLDANSLEARPLVLRLEAVCNVQALMLASSYCKPTDLAWNSHVASHTLLCSGTSAHKIYYPNPCRW